MTDFYSQNRCVCSTRSHGPLLCAFCLSFHFNIRFKRTQCPQPRPSSLFDYNMAAPRARRLVGDSSRVDDSRIARQLNELQHFNLQNAASTAVLQAVINDYFGVR